MDNCETVQLSKLVDTSTHKAILEEVKEDIFVSLSGEIFPRGEQNI